MRLLAKEGIVETLVTDSDTGKCFDCLSEATCTYRDVPLCTDCANHMAAQYDVCAVDGDDDSLAVDDDESRERGAA
jgi:hypothetical protein